MMTASRARRGLQRRHQDALAANCQAQERMFLAAEPEHDTQSCIAIVSEDGIAGHERVRRLFACDCYVSDLPAWFVSDARLALELHPDTEAIAVHVLGAPT